MKAMVLDTPEQALRPVEMPTPAPGPEDVLLDVETCAVCRTDLHIVDGDLTEATLPLVPGHEIVGRVAAMGTAVQGLAVGQRVGVPWLGGTCGHCRYCQKGAENLCDTPVFTGYTRDGGFAEQCLADARFVVKLPDEADPAHLAPLLCAGLIGHRSLGMTGDAKRLGLYGFGAAAHIVAQVARILPITTATMFMFGPLMMVATHFQAIGDAPRAGLLGLSRTYLFGLPLTLLLPLVLGEVGIWLAGPVAECLVLGLTVWVLWRRRRRG